MNFAAVVILVIAAFLVYENLQSAPLLNSCNSCGGCINLNCQITNDPNTWPTGDRIWLICHAIAIAEGANIAGSVPDRLNNPGDISDGLAEYGGEWHNGSDVTVFPDKQTGWQWLHNKISNIAAGKSLVYSATDSWATIAQKYAGNSAAWLNNVVNTLGVDPNSTLQDYLNA